MRKIINSTYITLDGAIEGPHLWPGLGDSAKAVSYDVQMELLDACDTILMGRRTYEAFASAWPTRSGDRMADRINAIQKQVLSTTLRNPTWNNTQVIDGDAVERIRLLKSQPGKAIVQYGLGQVSFTLLEHGLLAVFRDLVEPCKDEYAPAWALTHYFPNLPKIVPGMHEAAADLPQKLIWPDQCQAPIGLSHGFRASSLSLYESTAQESRDARAEVGDDDHAHIRGLVTGISFVRRGG